MADRAEDSFINHNCSAEGDSDSEAILNVPVHLKEDGEVVSKGPSNMAASPFDEVKQRLEEQQSEAQDSEQDSDHPENRDSLMFEERACGGVQSFEKQGYSLMDALMEDFRERESKERKAKESGSNVSLLEHSSVDMCSAQGTDGSSSFYEFEQMESREGTIIEEDERDHFHAPYEGGLQLDELDDDVLYLIASHLEARVVRFALSHVCTRFQALFDTDSYWRMRVIVRCPKKYPAVDCPREFSWADVCVEREDCSRVWQNPDVTMRHFLFSFDFSGDVDAVHLMNGGQYLVSGDRSRCLNLIDLTKYPDTEMRDMITFSEDRNHEGWIWSITTVDSTVITGCWDTKVRLFDVSAGMALTSTYRTSSAVLSLYAEQHEIVASCFDKTVFFIDPRSDSQRPYTYHTKSVLTICGDDKYIITGSEDKSIAVFDRTAGKVMKTVKLNHYPYCMSYKDNRLWFGDKAGHLHLYDGTCGTFNSIGKYSVGIKHRVTGIVDTWGGLFTSAGNTLQVLEPTRDPAPIASINVPEKVIARIAYDQGVLVSAVTGGIRVWLPKYWAQDNYLL